MRYGHSSGLRTHYPRLRPITGSRLYGVTWDAVTALTGASGIPTSLTGMASASGHFPFSRIVFDEQVNASSYVAACNAINPVSFIMGEILDSFYVNTYTPAQYSARVTDYLNTLGTKVDLWEVGNEINGEWVAVHTNAPTAQDTADIVTKIYDAYKQVKARGYRAALTLYWSGPPDNGTASCWAQVSNAMIPWATNNIPTDMKNGLDYVLVSFYEDDCKPAATTDWDSVFQTLASMFPNSQLGFGENGTKIAGTAVSVQQNKIDYINKWYSLAVSAPRYINGHFWWYGRQDLLPGNSSNAIWNAYNTVTAAN